MTSLTNRIREYCSRLDEQELRQLNSQKLIADLGEEDRKEIVHSTLYKMRKRGELPKSTCTYARTPSSELRPKVIDLYRQGLTKHEIKNRLYCHIRTVEIYLKEANNESKRH